MAPYPKLWWRVPCGILLGLVVLLAGASVGGFFLLMPWSLVRLPPCWALTYRAASAGNRATSERLIERTIDILRQRIDPQGVGGIRWCVAGPDRFEVRLGSSEPAMAAQQAYERALEDVRDGNVPTAELESALSLHVPPRDRAALPPEEARRQDQELAAHLAALKQEHPGSAGRIDAAANAHHRWGAMSQGLVSRRKLERIIARRGVLEFRVVPGNKGGGLDESAVREYVDLLQERGPEAVRKMDRDHAWFPISRNDRKAFAGMIQEQYAGRWHLLLCNLEGNTMRHDGSWRVRQAFRDADSRGRPAIGFLLDSVGGGRFGDLTAAHVGSRLAILIDDEVFSAPKIQCAVSDRGIISGSHTSAEIDDYVRLLGAEPLPVRIDPRPVSAQAIPGGNPPGHVIKRVLLIGLALLAALCFLMGFRAVLASRVAQLGAWALGASGAAIVWWLVAVWRSFVPQSWAWLVIASLLLPLIPLLVVWIVAVIKALRAEKLPNVGA